MAAPAPAAPPPSEAAQALSPGSALEQHAIDEPLTETEISEMKGHLRFLFKNREALRLKVNASEDLLLNGAREPGHRGAVLHLLGKVDLSTVTSALTRLPDARARTTLLGGVVRFSRDVGILLLYLETLHDVTSRSDAAAAFGLAVRRIDFATVSPTRMRRVLDLIAATFEGHERVQVLFGLLQSPTFGAAFDASREALPEALATVFVPLRAVHEVVVEGRRDRFGGHVVRDGVRALLDAPEDVLRAYPEAVRERLLESAMRHVGDPALEDRATASLLATLPSDGRAFSRVGMLRAQELLRRHDDAGARALLSAIGGAHPGFRMPAKWLAALDAPRVARLALWGGEGEVPRGRFRSAFWLDAQRSAWARMGLPEDADRMVREALLQRQVAMSGVAPVLECGVDPAGIPYVVLPLVGRPLDGLMGRRSLDAEAVRRLALAGAQILHGLALVGVQIPDADPGRFLASENDVAVLAIADLSGAQRVAPEAAGAAHRALARGFCAAARRAAREDVEAPDLDDGAGALPDLIRSLAARA